MMIILPVDCIDVVGTVIGDSICDVDITDSSLNQGGLILTKFEQSIGGGGYNICKIISNITTELEVKLISIVGSDCISRQIISDMRTEKFNSDIRIDSHYKHYQLSNIILLITMGALNASF